MNSLIQSRAFHVSLRVLRSAPRPATQHKSSPVRIPAKTPVKIPGKPFQAIQKAQHIKKPVNYAFPQILRIYAAPHRRLYSVVIQKTTYIFFLLGACLVVLPYVWAVQSAKGERSYLQLATIYCIGLGPLVIYSYVSAPFVVSISMLLPPAARMSKEALFKHLQNLPRDNRAIVQCLRIFPWQKTNVVNLKDLRFIKPKSWIDMTNMELHGAKETRKFWEMTWERGKSRFYVDPKFNELEAGLTEMVPAPGAWAAVRSYIQRSSRNSAGRSTDPHGNQKDRLLNSV
ncbi:hypothetical protein EJ05DRAFT_117924 [Pseudovirgaria hyperparasitica]|uniref:Uncharacterized protein n=1 Tax=Pseudovirgaria hyperparasitica TaxID=470096 RepID=A0A6A6VWJ3_9PEZI|nr:uncharacterized protein EJ05DRAFT_117924 [Pseudovirgaria hyperparasitica]KAF2754962.1 hypothetical protein EJ05DRAFT_117924 [Pseudovirgaria hyperparasitica]